MIEQFCGELLGALQSVDVRARDRDARSGIINGLAQDRRNLAGVEQPEQPEIGVEREAHRARRAFHCIVRTLF